jgi:hypothetical protein
MDSSLLISNIVGARCVIAHSTIRPFDARLSSPCPTFSATASNLTPFLCANDLALNFIVIPVLVVGDVSNDGKVRRVVGLSEKEREWATRSHSNCYDHPPVQKNVTGSPAPATVTTQTSHHQRPVFPKRLFGTCYFILVLLHLSYILRNHPPLIRLAPRFSPAYTRSRSPITLA